MAPLCQGPCAGIAGAALSSVLADGHQSWKYNYNAQRVNGLVDTMELIHPRGKAARFQAGLCAHYILISILYSGCIC